MKIKKRQVEPALGGELPRVLKPLVEPLSVHESDLSNFHFESDKVLKKLDSEFIRVGVELAARCVVDVSI
jgi:hypothetical protein